MKGIPTSGQCQFNPMMICGVVTDLKNCPFHDEEECKSDDNNFENKLGEILANNSILLRPMRYHKFRLTDEVCLCNDCKVIWTPPIEECPICKGDDEDEDN